MDDLDGELYDGDGEVIRHRPRLRGNCSNWSTHRSTADVDVGGDYLHVQELVRARVRPFTEALVYARSLKLATKLEWDVWSKSGARPVNIPTSPHRTYAHDGWQGYGHWLGTGKVGVKKDQQFLPFKKALLYARSLKLKGFTEWRNWTKTGVRPAAMPSDPGKYYKHDGWQGFGHWLGTGNVAPQSQHFLPFKKALLHARSLKLKSTRDWQAWCKNLDRPANIPAGPHTVYKYEGWQGYGHWLGTGKVANKDQQFLTFKDALLYVRSLRLKTQHEWAQWCKSGARPVEIPSMPNRVYRHDGWQGIVHWLGTGNVKVNVSCCTLRPALPLPQRKVPC